MIQFQCDYAEGAHPNILKRLIETNDLQTVGYGEDEICDSVDCKVESDCKHNHNNHHHH